MKFMSLEQFKAEWLHAGTFDDRSPQFHNGALRAYDFLAEDFYRRQKESLKDKQPGSERPAEWASPEIVDGQRFEKLMADGRVKETVDIFRRIRGWAFQIMVECDKVTNKAEHEEACLRARRDPLSEEI